MHTQKGFGLIEVLIAVTLLSVGMLGMATLQTAAVKVTNRTSNKNLAHMMATDMVTRIMANKNDSEKGKSSVYDSYSKQHGNAFTADTAGFTTPNCYRTSGCQFYQLAQTDLAEWKNNIAQMLPDGEGVISTGSPSGTGRNKTIVYTITISWASGRP